MAHPAHRDAGVWLVLAYKGGKSALWLVLATVLGVMATTGRIDHFRELAAALHDDLVSRWSIELAQLAIDALSPRGLRLVELGLASDAAITLLEFWALWRGQRWGTWLVLGASALPLPLETWAVWRHASPWRALLLAANVAVVLYLARWLRRHHRGEPG
jgi:uncharacterized membrane protein (DUF2068 family)